MLTSFLREFLRPINFASTSRIYAVAYCSILALLYVGSLYVNKSPFPRDHPVTVWKRFKGVIFVSLVAPVLAFLWGKDADESLQNSSYTIFHWLGMHTDGILIASLLPMALTMILFLGPIMQLILETLEEEEVTHSSLVSLKTRIARSLHDIIWWRNYIVAPFTEEFVFRACMLPFLVPAFGCRASVILCPLFFGIAHVHHAVEGLRMGMTLGSVIIRSVFQMGYTTIFGAYSAFLFLRTGHLAGPVLCHTFCNFMGFPEFDRIPHSLYPKTIATTFLFGLLGFYLLLFPLTDPVYFSSIYWDQR
ncbi:CAAX prenyl protease 2-like [Rhopilema esculentum]|uniref:CAAX prenyl protease 2-like n=1 Tax=Rhopilema esculentum TaxID=499914 RepID=UPI0031D86800